ncbi:hypothetical protein BASA62_008460 [Batrachochytrium salamandrivorans]|nr:hypothetical protein BASA62_008460 [Batrachochytrium salamandrivorans]
MSKSEILILAICCNGAKFIDLPNEDVNSDPSKLISRCNAGDRYFEKAVKLVGTAILQPPCYEKILAFFYLCCYTIASGKFSGGVLFFSTALRFAQLIGLDNERQNPESYKWSQEERELRRRIWWMIYELDRYTSTSGRMSMLTINASSLDTPFPCPDNLLHTVTSASSKYTIASLKEVFQEDKESSDVSTQSLVRNSSISVFPSISSYRLTILMILTKTYDLVLDEYDLSTDPKVLLSAELFSRRRHDISKDLVLFRKSLPEWITNISEYFAQHIETNLPSDTGNWIPFSLPMNSQTAVQLAGATVLTLFNHTQISLFLAQFYCLQELGMHRAIQSDPKFALSLKSALEIYEIARWIMRTPMHLSVPPPSLCKCIASAGCIVDIAHRVGFMGVTREMRDEILATLEKLLKSMLSMWMVPVKALQIIRALMHNSYVMNSKTPVWI